MQNSSLTSSKEKKQPPRKVPRECRICGADAQYSSYGTIACHACKVFFKRNAEEKQVSYKQRYSPPSFYRWFSQKVLNCQFGGHCEVNTNTRHVCSSCRLAKCFASGMQTELLRSSRSALNESEKKRERSTNSQRTILKVLKRLNEPEQVRLFYYHIFVLINFITVKDLKVKL